jgi:hypothetical protein
MSSLVIAAVCGFVGGALAILIGVYLFTRKLGKNDTIMISKEPCTETYKDVDILEHSPRPQGLYVRFRNRGSKPIEMAHFNVRGYRDGKLWAECEEGIYAEVQPGAEQEGILKLQDYRGGASKTVDLADCMVEVKFLFGYVLTQKTV